MTNIVRDAAAAEDFVYLWPVPLTGDATVTCAEHDVVVVCPRFVVGHTLGPGTHTVAQAPNLNVYFVKTAPQSVSFEGSVGCTLAGTSEIINVSFHGEVRVKVGDVGLLCHQFVGLPFDNLNGGLVRSVRRSLCRQLGKVIARRAMAARDDSSLVSEQAQASILDEAASNNPLAGAVFGFEFVSFASAAIQIAERMASPHLSSPLIAVPPMQASGHSNGSGWTPPAAGETPPWSEPETKPSAGVVAGEIGFGGRKSQPSLITPEHGDMARAATAVQASQPDPVEVPPGWYPPGSRVLVYWRDGLWHAAVVIQIAQGQYEVELGSSGERAWVAPQAVMPG